MSSHEACRSISVIAGASLVTSQFLFGKINTSGLLIVNDTANAMPDGVIGENVASGVVCPLILPGSVVQVKVGSGGVTNGALVGTANDGTCVAAGASNGHVVCGRALEAGAEGEIISILFSYYSQINA